MYLLHLYLQRKTILTAKARVLARHANRDAVRLEHAGNAALGEPATRIAKRGGKHSAAPRQ